MENCQTIKLLVIEQARVLLIDYFKYYKYTTFKFDLYRTEGPACLIIFAYNQARLRDSIVT